MSRYHLPLILSLMVFSISCSKQEAAPAKAAPEKKAEQVQPAAPDSGQAPTPAPALSASDTVFRFDEDSIQQLMVLDYEMPLRAITHPGKSLKEFKKKLLLIFYFSSTCGHCKHTAPFVMELAGELSALGVEAVAIGTSRSSDASIKEFVNDFKVHVPTFQDTVMAFGSKYGTGYVPLVFLVSPKGNYIRFQNFKEGLTAGLVKKALKQKGLFN